MECIILIRQVFNHKQPDLYTLIAHCQRLLLLIIGLIPVQASGQVTGSGQSWSYTTNSYTFTWNLTTDLATVSREGMDRPFWQGGLLPAFWLQRSDGEPYYVKATVEDQLSLSDQGGTLSFTLEDFGSGQLAVQATPWGIRFEKITVQWNDQAPAIIGMYFGTAALTEHDKQIVPSVDVPFWPNWEGAGFCVPSAKGGPIQSYFRKWDFGHANIALGNFGPSLGTPYAAAFPRPIYSAAMGGYGNWVVLGAGSIPEGAMSLQIKSSRGCFHFLYREDLWGAPKGLTRTWNDPLRLTWAEDAWTGFDRLFQSFEIVQDSVQHQKSFWNTWGDWRRQKFDIDKTIDFAHEVQTDRFVFDDPWETYQGSGEPNFERFPQLKEQIQYAKDLGMEVGYWQTVGWVDNPDSLGLTHDDLILGKDGKPRLANWSFNPSDKAHYCLDPSSPRVVAFLQERTRKAMEFFHPSIIKLDFAYALPNPNVGAPRNPALRGEHYGYTLTKIIAEAAREINPDITIMHYSIHPLMRQVGDLVSLDDQGDAGNAEEAGHQQWSVWAALAGHQGTAITASSGYDWTVDTENLLNTAVLGAPSAVLPRDIDGKAVPEWYLNQRKALFRWHRQTTGWTPLWLNSDRGDLDKPLTLRCWGRLETIQGKQTLTALALRDEDKESVSPEALPVSQWNGRWALISQDDQAIDQSDSLVCIPFDAGQLQLKRKQPPQQLRAVYAEKEQDYPHWKWEEGTLTLNVDEEDIEQLLGFIILEK